MRSMSVGSTKVFNVITSVSLSTGQTSLVGELRCKILRFLLLLVYSILYMLL